MPEELIAAVRSALTESPTAERLGISAYAVVPQVVEGLGPDPVDIVFAFGSAQSSRRIEIARQAAALKSKGGLIGPVWDRLFESAAFPALFNGFAKGGQYGPGLEEMAWENPGGWALQVSICPLSQVEVSPEDVAAAWAHYQTALLRESRTGARNGLWETARGYLQEFECREQLDHKGMVTRAWVNFFDGEQAGKSKETEGLLKAFLALKDKNPPLLDLLEFLIVSDQKPLALKALAAVSP